MAISLAGLDLSFLKNPANRLPPREKKERINFRAKRSDKVASPYFVADIQPFLANATRETVEIGSRSQLRAYERANDIRQCGDYKPGEIISAQDKRIAAATTISEADKKASDFKWID